MIRRFLAPVAALPLLALAACGGGDDEASGTTGPSVPADVVVTAVDGLTWDAESYTAASHDGKVVLEGRNDSNLAHNLYVVGSDGRQLPQFLDLPQKGSDGVETLSVEPGTYTIICKIPGHSNMKAELIVN